MFSGRAVKRNKNDVFLCPRILGVKPVRQVYAGTTGANLMQDLVVRGRSRAQPSRDAHCGGSEKTGERVFVKTAFLALGESSEWYCRAAAVSEVARNRILTAFEKCTMAC